MTRRQTGPRPSEASPREDAGRDDAERAVRRDASSGMGTAALWLLALAAVVTVALVLAV